MPITVSELLYFKKPTTITTYSDIPNESPEISRLLSGRKPFPSADTAMQKMPKKIIVDLGMRYALNRSKKKALDNRIRELQNEGMSVYYYHNDQLSEYDVEIVEHITMSRICPKADQLSQILSIPVDEIFVLNGECDYLFISGFDAMSCDNLSQIVSLVSKEKIRSVIINSKQPLSEIDAFINEFPTIKHIFLKRTSYRELLNLKDYSNLSALETIDLDLYNSDITSAQLAKILSEFKINILDLTGCNNIQDTFPEEINSSELKNLNLRDSSITSMSLASIVQHACNLQVLNLQGCANINDPLPTNLFFPKLEELNVCSRYTNNYCSISGGSLANILEHTQKLKILNLNHYRNIQDVRLPYGLEFPELEELHFSTGFSISHSVTMNVLTDFLSRSPNIKLLDLGCCKEIKGDLPDELALSQLEEINLSYSSLSVQSIYKILNQATGLKKLSLSYCPYYVDIATLCLPLLEHLNLSSSTISTQMLNCLLLNGRHLKYLDCTGCNNIEEAISNDAEFPELITLKLSRSTITSTALYKILKTAHQLLRDN